MAKFELPTEVTALPAEQQAAIRKIMVRVGLLTESGELANLHHENISSNQKAAVNATLASFDVKQDVDGLVALDFGWPNVKCTVARVAEVAAVAACMVIPGGQIAIAACVALAHAAADEVCK